MGGLKELSGEDDKGMWEFALAESGERPLTTAGGNGGEEWLLWLCLGLGLVLDGS